MKHRYMLFIFLTVLSIVTFQTPRPAHAATIMVTTTTDEFNSDGDCSLREAIQSANTNTPTDACVVGSNSATDTIMLANGATYTITRIGSGEDANLTGDFDILNNATSTDIAFSVVGGGSATIDANNIDRAINGQSGVHITMSNITIQNGHVNSHGGGIWMQQGSISLNNMTFNNNIITSNDDYVGGALYANGNNPITITNSVFTNNSATAWGGAIALEASFTISNVIFSGNSTRSFGGGAVFATTPISSEQNISQSTFSNNTAGSDGGAIQFAGGTLVVQRSTFNGNIGEQGGAISVRAADTALIIQESTFSGNDANDGKAVYMDTTFITATISNSTITGSGGVSEIKGLFNAFQISGSIISGTC